ncbi:glycoside hydrolase family 28 protein [Maribellus comscasis]|uniref:Glycoside hydrolase family 28 protein n=1 Tax=Maribellus comscasis TaxID=2681766 RepID=A0A6I6K1H2_9BACT|nr:glycoside hydrolase family 28 protein [Maribellus comscasis]QGY47298.1 glycoside hydrolase family 28 protein [Maribellus comscasis]
MNIKVFTGIVFLCLATVSAKSQQQDWKVDASVILEKISEPDFPDRIFKISSETVKENVADVINKKIDECSKAGGGKVVLASGEYFCEGPLILKDNVNLHLEKNTKLVFSQKPEDYLPVVLVRWEGTEAWNYSPFIYASDVENIAITGKGIIDGNGSAEESFREWRPLQKKDQNKLREMGKNGVPVNERVFGKGHFLRPQLIHLLNCKNILLEDITIKNGAFWLIQPTYCDNITVRGVKVDSRFINNDGVDIDSDTNVLIENCNFNTGDDFVAIKSGRDQDGWRVNKPSKNILIRNCVSENCLHGISFGSELSGGIENVICQNLTFKKVRSYGVQFKSNKDRGGYLKNVILDNIQIDTAETCISFTNQYHSYSGGNNPTAFENILIRNLKCNIAQEKAISMIGLPEMPIQNVKLENVTIQKSGELSVVDNVINMSFINVKY